MGASGLLGSAVCRDTPVVIVCWLIQIRYGKTKDDFQTTSLPLDQFIPVIRELFDQWPDALVNCAAISSPDLVDQDPQTAEIIKVVVVSRLPKYRPILEPGTFIFPIWYLMGKILSLFDRFH